MRWAYCDDPECAGCYAYREGFIPMGYGVNGWMAFQQDGRVTLYASTDRRYVWTRKGRRKTKRKSGFLEAKIEFTMPQE